MKMCFCWTNLNLQLIGPWGIRMNFWTSTVQAQSLDTDVQRPFYSVATVALLPY